MGIFSKERTDGATYDGQGDSRKGLIDRVKYNGEPDELVWKFPFDNLSTMTQLIVNESQEAIFLKGGMARDKFGPGTHTLSANNIPILQSIVNLPFGGNTPFTAEVWYVSKTVRRNLKFGTPTPISLLDPLYQVRIPVKSFGDYGIQITDSVVFLTQLVGTQHLFKTADIIEQFKGLVVQKLTVSISKYIVQQKVTVVEISAYLDDLSSFVKNAINEEFAQYGVSIVNFNIMSVNFEESDPNVQKILDSQSEAAKRRMEGYTYQQEQQFGVMKTAAGNEGMAGSMMGAGMGLGMGVGVGGAFGQQMGGMASVMAPPAPPPPPAAAAFHILVNGAQQGPYDIGALQGFAQGGQLSRDTLAWRQGMAGWVKASDVPELQGLFAAPPPPPPPPPSAPPPPPPPPPAPAAP